MTSLTRLLLILGFIGLSLQMYEAGSKVVKLTQSNFKEKVLNSPGIWFVEFYGSLLLTSSLVRPLQEPSS